FEKVNEHIIPIRESYNSLNSNKDLINELLAEGSAKVRPMAKELLLEVRDSIGISKIS
ncbi:MAG: tryptophan--tRNA ligase, partial [Gammaproteobacteria bacterium]|nr:tryptophan--tRNA ligase [Gammaproteobacteria bacterium]